MADRLIAVAEDSRTIMLEEAEAVQDQVKPSSLVCS